MDNNLQQSIKQYLEYIEDHPVKRDFKPYASCFDGRKKHVRHEIRTISGLRDMLYKSSCYKKWRKEVLVRDNYTCQECGVSQEGFLHVHHVVSFSKIIREIVDQYGIDYIWKNYKSIKRLWDKDNGITLCYKCHRETDNYPKSLRGKELFLRNKYFSK